MSFTGASVGELAVGSKFHWIFMYAWTHVSHSCTLWCTDKNVYKSAAQRENRESVLERGGKGETRRGTGWTMRTHFCIGFFPNEYITRLQGKKITVNAKGQAPESRERSIQVSGLIWKLSVCLFIHI